jgi:hypothetical protein
MKSIGTKVMLAAVALGVALFTLAGTASATLVAAEVTVPADATVGQPAEVQARLRTVDDGLPVSGTPVIFYTHASFAGVSGVAEIGRAITDENGVATLVYEPRAASEHEIRIEYIPPGETEPAVAAGTISVVDGASQLHRSEAGVDIPGLSVWLLIALVSTVWAILLSVALRVVAIARDGGEAETAYAAAHGQGHEPDWLGTTGLR